MPELVRQEICLAFEIASRISTLRFLIYSVCFEAEKPNKSFSSFGGILEIDIGIPTSCSATTIPFIFHSYFLLCYYYSIDYIIYMSTYKSNQIIRNM